MPVLSVSKTHLSSLISDGAAVMLGSCAYNADISFPAWSCSATYAALRLKNWVLAISELQFRGGEVRSVSKFAESGGWELMCEPAEVTGTATPG